MHRPITDHWKADKCVIQYLSGTQDHGVYLRRNNTTTLHAFTNVDWPGNKDDYTSIGAYIVYLGQHPVE